MGNALIEIESVRSLRERPDNPDPFDLVLCAHAIDLRPASLERENQELALFERALVLDPSYAPALIGSGYVLVDTDRIYHKPSVSTASALSLGLHAVWGGRRSL